VGDSLIFSGEVALTFLGENIPAIGPRFENRDEAVKAARLYFKSSNELTRGSGEIPVQIALQKQDDGRYSMLLESTRFTVGKLYNLDELLLKKFRKGLKKKLFILTCFVNGTDDPECLVLTEGLGAVFFAPDSINNWHF